MKDWYDLTAAKALQSFPWEQTYRALGVSRKTVTTFYGDTHSTQHSDTISQFQDRDSWRWYNALKFGVQVEGFNVNLTSFIGDKWWARMHEPVIWKPTWNSQWFEPLHEWIRSCGIFTHTGRIVFFVQLAGQGSPVHTDFDPQKVYSHLRQPTDFLWLTPPPRPKQLIVGGEKVPWACWFNHFVPHGSEAEKDPRWSLRIDGHFTEEFRSQMCLP